MPWKTEEQRRIARRKWYEKNKEKHIQNVLEYKRKNPEVTAKAQRKFNYGITQENFLDLIQKQENSCAICRKVFTNTPHIDHDHGTKKIRGLLCRSCNLGLGYFKDNSNFLQQAIQYLGKV